MNAPQRTVGMLLALALAAPAAAEENDSGFVPMFNGKDLTGWINVNCAPSTFYVKDGEIITTGKPTGYLRTTKQYENFIAEFDWMHVPSKPGAVGNSGFFVWCDPIPAVGTGYTRGIEVQVLVNLTYKNKKGEITATSQGDLFSIHGATCVPDRPHPDGWARCLPSENHCKGEREWNHYRVEGNGGRLTLAVNGHVVSGVSKCNPRKGYLALESEGSECHFRNLKIKELPSTNPKQEEVADTDQGFRSLYTGLDLTGWKANDAVKEHWQARDTVLHYESMGKDAGSGLSTQQEFGDAEFIVDFRFPKRKDVACSFTLRRHDDETVALTLAPDGLNKATGPGAFYWNFAAPGLKAEGQWNRLDTTIRGRTLQVRINGKTVERLREFPVAFRLKKGAFLMQPNSDMDFANLFVRELK
jgi:hypothetical protein